jgi:hypothetical protein
MILGAMHRAPAIFALVATCILVGRPAASFCRTTTCAECPTDNNGCTVGGIPISWPQTCVSFSVQRDGSRIADYALAEKLVRSAFASWQSAHCGEGGGDTPSISLADPFGPALCSEHEYNVGRSNANTIVFHDDAWPYGTNVLSILALTTVTYDKNSGDIYDADLEINGTQPLSTDTPVLPAHFDLFSILMHETGHFLGLAHSLDVSSVMQPSYITGDDSFRRLGSDDEAGICQVYRPDFPFASCDFTPRYGFSPDCAIAVNVGQGCAVSGGLAPKEGERSGRTTIIALALALGSLARRRQKVSSAPAKGSR